MANSTLGKFTCIGSASATRKFFALSDRSTYFNHRVYAWKPVEWPRKIPVEETDDRGQKAYGARTRCVMEFEFRCCIPISVFRVLEDFPRCEWSITARLEFVLEDWYTLAELGEYEAIAKHPKFNRITGREITSCSTKFDNEKIFHKLRIGERLNLVVEQTYRSEVVLAGAAIPILLYQKPEGW